MVRIDNLMTHTLSVSLCIFFVESHEQLVHQIGNNDDFICALLLPLCVATADELTEEENDQVPIDLQYLPSNKQLEPDRDIQLILLETVLLVRFLERI